MPRVRTHKRERLRAESDFAQRAAARRQSEFEGYKRLLREAIDKARETIPALVGAGGGKVRRGELWRVIVVIVRSGFCVWRAAHGIDCNEEELAMIVEAIEREL